MSKLEITLWFALLLLCFLTLHKIISDRKKGYKHFSSRLCLMGESLWKTCRKLAEASLPICCQLLEQLREMLVLHQHAYMELLLQQQESPSWSSCLELVPPLASCCMPVQALQFEQWLNKTSELLSSNFPDQIITVLHGQVALIAANPFLGTLACCPVVVSACPQLSLHFALHWA